MGTATGFQTASNIGAALVLVIAEEIIKVNEELIQLGQTAFADPGPTLAPVTAPPLPTTGPTEGSESAETTPVGEQGATTAGGPGGASTAAGPEATTAGGPEATTAG